MRRLNAALIAAGLAITLISVIAIADAQAISHGQAVKRATNYQKKICGKDHGVIPDRCIDAMIVAPSCYRLPRGDLLGQWACAGQVERTDLWKPIGDEVCNVYSSYLRNGRRSNGLMICPDGTVR